VREGSNDRECRASGVPIRRVFHSWLQGRCLHTHFLPRIDFLADSSSPKWRSRKRHYFILSFAGKPIYSRYIRGVMPSVLQSPKGRI
jgi:hypothetical protein